MVDDTNMVVGAAEPIVDFIFGPVAGNVRRNAQAVADAIYTQDGLSSQTVHPTCGAGIPGPTSSARVGRHAVDISHDDVRFDAISTDLVVCVGMVDRVK